LATIYTSSCGYNAIQASLPQAMLLCDEKENFVSEIPETKSYNAIGIGPGIGTHKKTVATLFQFLEKQNSPLILDADALNIIATDKKYLHLIPKNSIITPHPKEFERLFGKSENDFERHNLQVQQAKALGIIIVLKGANTAIAMPDGNTYFNSTGNPGMATAGSGDVLTGIITSFLAQGHLPEDAAIMGVFIHGMAGDVAAKNKSQTFITAMEIIDSLSSVFMSIEEKIV
jgi:NAD(P)H-hydrate epimerase